MTFDDASEGGYGASPTQHLLAAVGACALIDVETILRKKRLTFSNLRVECVGTRRDEPFPRVFLNVRLVFRVDGDVPQKVFEDVVKLSVDKYCTVAGTLRESAPVEYACEVGAPPG